jgi:hypothetical protein
MEEIFKSIEEYEGLYEISNLGRVKSLAKNGKKEIIMKPKIDKDGYLQISLRKPRTKRKYYRIHRLVALTFIDNINQLPQVNHIDCNPSNNNVENLEWCTIQYNNKYRFTIGKASHVGEKSPLSTITNEIACNIYYTSQTTNLTELQISKLYNTTRSIVNKIRLGYRWGKITGAKKNIKN